MRTLSGGSGSSASTITKIHINLCDMNNIVQIGVQL